MGGKKIRLIFYSLSNTYRGFQRIKYDPVTRRLVSSKKVFFVIISTRFFHLHIMFYGPRIIAHSFVIIFPLPSSR